MCIGIFSFRAFDRRLARLAAPISSGVRQGGGQNLPPPPAGRVRLNTPAGRGLKDWTDIHDQRLLVPVEGKFHRNPRRDNVKSTGAVAGRSKMSQ